MNADTNPAGLDRYAFRIEPYTSDAEQIRLEARPNGARLVRFVHSGAVFYQNPAAGTWRRTQYTTITAAGFRRAALEYVRTTTPATDWR